MLISETGRAIVEAKKRSMLSKIENICASWAESQRQTKLKVYVLALSHNKIQECSLITDVPFPEEITAVTIMMPINFNVIYESIVKIEKVQVRFEMSTIPTIKFGIELIAEFEALCELGYHYVCKTLSFQRIIADIFL